MRSIVSLAGIASRLMEAAVEGAEGGAPAETAKPAKKAEVEKVKMEDGRELDFTGKRKMLKDEEFPEGGNPIIILDFRNGKTIRSQIPPHLLLKAAAHGWSQKLGDETAGCEDVEDMVLAVEELDRRLNAKDDQGNPIGQWNSKREGGGMSGTSVLLKALIELSGQPAEKVKAFLTGKTQQEKAALRNSAKVKPIVDRLEAEKVKGTVDTDALLLQLT